VAVVPREIAARDLGAVAAGEDDRELRRARPKLRRQVETRTPSGMTTSVSRSSMV
jgi:hypothetical protein